MPTADEARIRELKRYGVTVFHKEMDGDSGWWWRREGGRLNGPFPSDRGVLRRLRSDRLTKFNVE